jgi:hypothetical protein
LLSGESVDGYADGHEPFGLIVGGVQLVQQEAAQGCGRLRLILGVGWKREHQNQN